MKKYTKTSSEKDEILNVAFAGLFSIKNVLPRIVCIEL